MSGRNPGTLGVWGPRGTRVVAAESYWRQPLKWNAAAEAAGERHRVFCASLADVFEGPETMPAEAWPDVEAARRRLFELILDTPHLDWLLLTKRPQNIEPQLRAMPVLKRDNVWDHLWPHRFPNVWIGTSVENQAAADERIPHLLRVPARVRFLSCEPLLGPVDLSAYLTREVERWERDHEGTVVGQEFEAVSTTHWVIAGGESGGKARPMHPAWARSLRDQCQAAGVAFHFKQWGEYWPAGRSIVEGKSAVFMGDEVLYRVGKHAAGRLLDGRTWDEVPQ